MIPLPGPGPVQARQEKKRPPGSSGNSFPSPPAKILITKMTYGKDVQATTKDGRKFSFPRWWGNPNDLYELMRRMNRRVPMGFMPRYTSTPLPKFSFNPDEVPVLYITGHYEWSLSDKEVDKIRKYVLSGGFLFINPCCGNESFRKSADRQIPKIFPARPPERLAADHPLFRSYYPVKKVKYLLEKKDAYEESPVLFGIDVGCRTAVIYSPFDLGCAWNGHCDWVTEKGHYGQHIMGEGAIQLGVNIMAYTQGSHRLGRYLGGELPTFHERKAPGAPFVFTQLKRKQLDWDCDPTAATVLLQSLADNLKMNPDFKRNVVGLYDPKLLEQPIAYMTGHSDFKWNAKEVNNLKEFVSRGGVLLSDSCCGKHAFDAAFRREIKAAFPDLGLKTLPSDHVIYTHQFYPLKEIRYNETLNREQPDLKSPPLEGIQQAGRLVVIYSKYDLLGGPKEGRCPYRRGVEVEDSFKLAANIIGYVLAH